MKIVKGVVKIVGLIATVLSFIPGPHQPIAAAVAAVASVVSVALEVAAPTKARANARGSPTEYRLDPNTGIPYLMGRTQYAGTCIKRETYGKDNKYQTFTSVYSLGPIDGIEQFTADRAGINFDGAGNAIGQLHDRMWFRSQVGLCPSPFMDIPNVGYSYPGWDASRKLSGLAASHWTLKFDKDGEFYTGGPPTPGVVARGVKVYDPRLDSTYPGGSGACRALDESTYVYSKTPHLHALTYALGRWQNGKRRFGIGFPKEAIDIAYFVNAANVDEANQWEVSGLIFSNDSKWNCLKMIMECGGGEPITLGGRLSGSQSAPRVSIATITSKDICGRCSVTGTQGQRERINGVVPRYRSEAHGWEMIPAETVRIASYVTADGRLRTRELEWSLVNKVKQASQLSSYFIMNSREFGPIELTLKIRWVGLKPGDCVTLDIPELNLNNQKALVLNRSFDVSSGAVTLTLRSETDGKHASSLALDGSAPPIPSLTYDADAKPAAPAPGSWTLTVGALSSASGTVPSLRFIGAVDNDTAEGVEFAYRKVGTTEWFTVALAPPTATRADEAAVTPGAQYEGRVRYIAGGKFSLPLVIGPTTIEASAAGTAVIANSIVGQGPGATAPGSDVLNQYIGLGQNSIANSDFSHGDYGFTTLSFNNTGLNVVRGINLYPGFFGQLNVGSMMVQGSPAVGTFFDSHKHVPNTEGNELKNMQRWALPVVPGDKVFASALVSVYRSDARIVLVCYGGDASYVTEIHSSVGGRVDGAGAGDPANFDRVGAIFTVPSGTRYVAMLIRGQGQGLADPFVFYTQLMLAKIVPGQTAWPPYSPGPSDRWADQTNLVASTGDGNRVRYSLMESGKIGWKILWNPNGLSTYFDNWFLYNGNRYYGIGAIFTGNGQVISIGQSTKLLVVPGERLSAQARVVVGDWGISGRSAQLYLRFSDSLGGDAGYSIIEDNVPMNVDFQCQEFVTVPANAREAFFELYAYSNSGGGGNIDVQIYKPFVSSAGALQTIHPPFTPGPSNEFGADVTTQITGPASGNVQYDYTGTVIEAWLDLSYWLTAGGGTILADTVVSASYRVLDGTVNGFNSTSAPQGIPVSDAIGTLTISSLATDFATIEINLTRNGVTRKMTTTLAKVKSAAPVSGGGSGSASKTTGFTSINTNSFTDITGNLDLTTLAGKTMTRTVIDLNCKYPKTANQSGPWNVEFKLQRNISGTWTDIGALGNSNPDPYIDVLDDPPITIASSGQMNATIDNTGLTASTAYSYRVVARISSGGLPSNATMQFTGSVNITCP